MRVKHSRVLKRPHYGQLRPQYGHNELAKVSRRHLIVHIRSLQTEEEMHERMRVWVKHTLKRIRKKYDHQFHVQWDPTGENVKSPKLIAQWIKSGKMIPGDLVTGMPGVQYSLFSPQNLSQLWNHLVPAKLARSAWMKRQHSKDRKVNLLTAADFYPFPYTFPVTGEIAPISSDQQSTSIPGSYTPINDPLMDKRDSLQNWTELDPVIYDRLAAREWFTVCKQYIPGQSNEQLKPFEMAVNAINSRQLKRLELCSTFNSVDPSDQPHSEYDHYQSSETKNKKKNKKRKKRRSHNELGERVNELDHRCEVVFFDECEFGSMFDDFERMRTFLNHEYSPDLIIWDLPPASQTTFSDDQLYFNRFLKLNMLEQKKLPWSVRIGIMFSDRVLREPNHWLGSRYLLLSLLKRFDNTLMSFAMSASVLYASEQLEQRKNKKSVPILLSDIHLVQRMMLQTYCDLLDYFMHPVYENTYFPPLHWSPICVDTFGKRNVRCYLNTIDSCLGNKNSHLFEYYRKQLRRWKIRMDEWYASQQQSQKKNNKNKEEPKMTMKPRMIQRLTPKARLFLAQRIQPHNSMVDVLRFDLMAACVNESGNRLIENSVREANQRLLIENKKQRMSDYKGKRKTKNQKKKKNHNEKNDDDGSSDSTIANESGNEDESSEVTPSCSSQISNTGSVKRILFMGKSTSCYGVMERLKHLNERPMLNLIKSVDHKFVEMRPVKKQHLSVVGKLDWVSSSDLNDADLQSIRRWFCDEFLEQMIQTDIEYEPFLQRLKSF